MTVGFFLETKKNTDEEVSGRCSTRFKYVFDIMCVNEKKNIRVLLGDVLLHLPLQINRLKRTART